MIYGRDEFEQDQMDRGRDRDDRERDEQEALLGDDRPGAYFAVVEFDRDDEDMF